MARKPSDQWRTWDKDPRIQYFESSGGLKIRYMDDDWYRTSGWMRLIGGSIDATIGQHLREIGDPPPPSC